MGVVWERHAALLPWPLSRRLRGDGRPPQRASGRQRGGVRMVPGEIVAGSVSGRPGKGLVADGHAGPVTQSGAGLSRRGRLPMS